MKLTIIGKNYISQELASLYIQLNPFKIRNDTRDALDEQAVTLSSQIEIHYNVSLFRNSQQGIKSRFRQRYGRLVQNIFSVAVVGESDVMPPTDKTWAEIANTAARQTTSGMMMRIVPEENLQILNFATMNVWCVGSHHSATTLKSDNFCRFAYLCVFVHARFIYA